MHIRKEQRPLVLHFSAYNPGCLEDRVCREQGSRIPSRFFGGTSVAFSSAAPLQEDLSWNVYPES